MDPTMGTRKWACARSLGWEGELFSLVFGLLGFARSFFFAWLAQLHLCFSTRIAAARAPHLPPPNFVCNVGSHVLCKPQFFPAVLITRPPRQVYPSSSALRFRLKRKNFRAGTVGFGWSSLHLARELFSSSSRSLYFSSSSFVSLLPPSNALPCCVSSATKNRRS